MRDYKSAGPLGPEEVIVDLAPHADALMAYEDLSDLLTETEEAKMVDYVKSLLGMSYEAIKNRYPHWDEADRAHDVYVKPGATKFREKAVIGTTRAIADTVVTYQMAALTGRNPMFQLEGLNRNSRRGALVLERVLHAQMRRSAGEAKIAQLVMDTVRYGLAPTKIVWDTGRNTNQIVNFNPRRFFPDPRVHWGDWDQMSFVGFSDVVTWESLIATGLYPKLKKYPGLRKGQPPKAGWKMHDFSKEEGRGFSINPLFQQEKAQNMGFYQLSHARIIDEVWVRVPGWQVNLPSIDLIWLVVVILDEEVVIRFQLSPEGRQFPVVPGGLFYDRHKTFSQSLYDMLLPLHNISTWLLRSRIDNVQAAMTNLIFVDPAMVSIPDLIDRNPAGVVRTLPGVKPGDGVHVASMPDVTRGHLNDIAALSDLQQRLSAASDAQQGMPTADVRTATEIQRLSQMGSQRLGVLARILSATTVRPLVHMMASNIQDALDFNGSVRLGKDTVPELIKPLVKDEYLEYNVQDLQGELHYLVVDGTLPLEPTRSPETWMNIIQMADRAGLGMELDLKKMAMEAVRSMGISDIEQFSIPKDQPMSPSQQLSLMEKMRGMSGGPMMGGPREVVPDEQLGREVEKGNLAPAREAAE